MKFVVTVDTEADDQWAQDGSLSLSNIEALPRFQSFMEEHGATPTYLATYETLEHPRMRELVQAHSIGKAEIGGHLHPWTTPPLDEKDKTIQRFPLELPEGVLNAKLATLTLALHSLIGEQPHSFRAGRWGSNERVLRAVAAQGYTVDSSVTPGVNWGTVVRDRAQHERVPDFSDAGARPYRVAGTNLVEVPMSVLPTGLFPHIRPEGTIARLLARPRWCRIFPTTTLADLIAVHTAAKRMQLPALVFMIHSSELTVGASPYVKTPVALDRVYSLLGAFIAYLKKEQVAMVRMCDLVSV